MSAGPIAQERAAWRPVKAPRPKVVLGDIVTMGQHPAGFPRWRVIDVPRYPTPLDVVTLECVNRRCMPQVVRRWVRDLKPAEMEGEG